jgi:hypothetical protein
MSLFMATNAEDENARRTRKAVEALRQEAEKRSSVYGQWYFASAWEMSGEKAKHIFTTLFPLKKGCAPPREPDTRQYGQVKMVRGVLASKEIWTVISGLADARKFSLPGLPALPLVAHLYLENRPAWYGSRWPTFSLGYALNRYQFHIPSEYEARAPSEPAFSASLPIYPSVGRAIQDFCGVHGPLHSELNEEFQILLPDYRARICSVKLSSSRIRIECEHFGMDPRDFVGKMYLNGAFGHVHHDFEIGTPAVEMSVSGFPHELLVAILARTGNELIDQVRYGAAPSSPQPGVEVELGPQDLEEIILAGESETLEFKSDFPKKREGIAISAVAMANRKGGTVLLGVDDNGQIVGFEGDKPEEAVRNVLRDYCEPPLEPKVDVIDCRGKQVVRIEVQEGTNKPHWIKGKGPYIRSGSTNRIATRFEIDQMTGGQPHGWF